MSRHESRFLSPFFVVVAAMNTLLFSSNTLSIVIRKIVTRLFDIIVSAGEQKVTEKTFLL